MTSNSVIDAERAEAFYDKEFAGENYAPLDKPEEHIAYDLVRNFVDANNLTGKRCLEVGCGRGVFQDFVSDYIGTDVTDSVKPYLRKPFYKCDAGALPFDDNSFDAAWTVHVLEHVPEPQHALSELRRVVRPGGLLLIAPAWHTRSWFSEGYPVRPYSDFSLKGKLIKASIPLRDSPLVRYPLTLTSRLWRVLQYAGAFGPVNLKYRRLRANYEHFWMSDSDAVNSLDPFDFIHWFSSRGDRCACEGFLKSLFFRGLSITVTVNK